MNDRMRKFLADAAQERSKRVSGKPMNDYHLKIVMDASLSQGSGGFDRATLWLALLLATKEKS